MRSAPKPVTRSVLINREELTYKLRYSSKAKYLRLQISRGREVELVLPRGVQIKEAEDFLIKKYGWIEKHLRAKTVAEPEFMFMGKELTVRQSFELFIKRHRLIFKDGALNIISPEGSAEKPNVLYEAWLRHYSKKYLSARAENLARITGGRIGKVSVRAQKTRWGSCSAKGNLSFNYKLMRFRQEVIDYVIIHELCHLKEMNHSKRFWNLVSSYCPEYKKLRKELKGRTGN